MESEAYLHDMIVNQMAGKSVIMITHRYENLNGMDRIYKLENGRMIQLDQKSKHDIESWVLKNKNYN